MVAVISNLKLVLIMVILGVAIWFYKDYTYQVSENNRLVENASQTRMADSLHYSQQILSKDEIIQYVSYQNKSLQRNLADNKIALNRIESIISNSYTYQDTTRKETDLSRMIADIRNNIPTSQQVVDTTDCMTTKGLVQYKDNKLTYTVLDRQFKNQSDAVGYWERREWSFLGIKTRFLGKKRITAKTFNTCGESKTIKIEKRK